MKKAWLCRWWGLVICGMVLGACTVTPLGLQEDKPKPFEKWNRGVYRLNRVLDQTVLRPVHFLFSCFPSFLKKGIYHILLNAERPISMVNALLQLNMRSFAEHTTCLVFNSTLGLGGFFDVADPLMGLHPERLEFGDTLEKYLKIPGGGLFMVPVLGPFQWRDFLSRPVDFLCMPSTYFDRWIYFGTKFCEEKSRSIDIENAMEKTFSDPYAIIESIYKDKQAVRDGTADATDPLDQDLAEAEEDEEAEEDRDKEGAEDKDPAPPVPSTNKTPQ